MNYVNSWNRVMQNLQGSSESDMKEDSIMTIPKEDRETLFKRVDDGIASPNDIFLIIRGRQIKNSYIAFSEIELIFRRLGINFTEHRYCELLAASKLAHSKKAVGYTKLNFSYIEECEFESILEYLEYKVGMLTKHNLSIAPRNLMMFSMLMVLIYIAMVYLSQSLLFFFYGGDILGALLCSFIPVATMLLVSRIKVWSNVEPKHLREEFIKAFEAVTNSKAELLA